MIQQVLTNQLFRSGGNYAYYPENPQILNPMTIQANSVTQGAWWVTPRIQTGVTYTPPQYQEAVDANKPSPDSFKVLRLIQVDTNNILEICILDTDCTSSNPNYSTWSYNVNGLGGSVPVMPLVTIPAPIIESGPVSGTATTARTFLFLFPNKVAAYDYLIQGWTFNRVAAYVTPPTDKSTTGEMATWATSNLPDYGTWSAPSANILQLVSDNSDTVPVLTAGIIVAVKRVDYCFDLTAYSTPAAVNGVKFGSEPTQALIPFMLTDDPNVLKQALIPVMGNAIFSTAVANKLGVATTQAQPKLYFDATLIETATAAVCS